MNDKAYIGSSVNLGRRLSNYLSINYLSKRVLMRKSKIYNALLTYGYNNFRLEILEYCDRSIVLKREQYFIDKYKPEYNILTKAGSTLGFKHYEETLSKYRLRRLSPEALNNLKKAKVGTSLPLSAKYNHELSESCPITLKNIETSNLIKYNSIRSAARDFKVNHSSLLYCLTKNKLFKDKYIIKKYDNKPVFFKDEVVCRKFSIG